MIAVALRAGRSRTTTIARRDERRRRRRYAQIVPTRIKNSTTYADYWYNPSSQRYPTTRSRYITDLPRTSTIIIIMTCLPDTIYETLIVRTSFTTILRRIAVRIRSTSFPTFLIRCTIHHQIVAVVIRVAYLPSTTCATYISEITSFTTILRRTAVRIRNTSFPTFLIQGTKLRQTAAVIIRVAYLPNTTCATYINEITSFTTILRQTAVRIRSTCRAIRCNTFVTCFIRGTKFTRIPAVKTRVACLPNATCATYISESTSFTAILRLIALRIRSTPFPLTFVIRGTIFIRTSAVKTRVACITQHNLCYIH